MPRRILLTFAILALFAPVAPAQLKPGEPNEETVETFDGVKLRCRYYPAVKEGNGSCAILVHDYLANPDEGDWDGLARFLATDCSLNVVRFDFRGHGKSKEVVADKFWKEQWNQNKMTGSQKKPAKTTIDYKDFKADYYPMLVNDIAAARNLLDLKNDGGTANTRSVYIIASGSSASLVYLFLATEWNRQSTKPIPLGVSVAVPEIVTANGFRQAGTFVAGRDYAGAIFLSPTRTYNYEYGTSKGKSSIPNQTVKEFVSRYSKDNKGGGDLRTSTGMLFLYGDKDVGAQTDATFYFTDVMAAEAKSSKMEPMKFTNLVPLKGAKEHGVELLGKRSSLKTEDLIQTFITRIEDSRKRLSPLKSNYDKPFRIGLASFGIN